MKTVAQVHQETRAREVRKGFVRDYPRDPMIDMGFKLKRRELKVLRKFRETGKPFQRSPDERQEVSVWLIKQLATCYDMPAPNVVWTGDGMGDSGASNYDRETHTLTFTGHWSYITLLHEFAHSLGYGEQGAVWYSVNVFRRSFPTSFWKLKRQPGTHFLFRSNDAPPSAVALERSEVTA